ncbi:amidohydrolase family protein [Lysobacter enzymogenes]|uniref:amidohydrolase family protein n=1 Tax=Lysobacter enzymogenes TaxID=69 RepID=UPI00089D1E51|nr:amidohydrolase family protein [Lysobacter enzymogenes]SDY11229.1 Imidazolonepropionase [Lysobacter enzymogenes]
MRRLVSPRLIACCFAVAAIAAAAVSVASAPAPAARTAEARTVEFNNGHWFDGEGFRTGTWYSVDGVLTRQRPARIDRVVDLAGSYATPPLAEAHNHNLQNAWGVRNFRGRYIDGGVQYAAMLCGDGADRDKARAALGVDAPLDVLYASACISSSDGHPLAMARRNPDGSLRPVEEVHDHDYLVMDSVEDIERKWPRVRAARPDLIKAILVHSERPERRDDTRYFGMNGLRAELLAPLVQRAHRDGLRVAAHVESAADFRVAVEAGVDAIAHLPGYQIWDGRSEADYRLDDADIALAARRKIPLIATAGAAQLVAGKDVAKLERVRALQRDNLRRLLAAGVPLAVGSDRFDATVRAEIDYLAALELMPPARLWRAAVQDTPTLLFPQRRIGRIAEGFEANFLVLADDPLSAPAALDRIRMKVRRGALY